jgi:hypothetical protein
MGCSTQCLPAPSKQLLAQQQLHWLALQILKQSQLAYVRKNPALAELAE